MSKLAWANHSRQENSYTWRLIQKGKMAENIQEKKKKDNPDRKKARDKKRNASRIAIGPEIDRWKKVKEENGFKDHSSLAKFLLDWYVQFYSFCGVESYISSEYKQFPMLWMVDLIEIYSICMTLSLKKVIKCCKTLGASLRLDLYIDHVTF